ncbi:MAG: GNAT family N-acetyltransferase [Flavobacteriaceae bacterium]
MTTMTKVTIRQEELADWNAIETILDTAFGEERYRKTAQRLREGRLPAEGLSLVAVDGDQVVGTIRMWHVTAGNVPALLLGPVAVDCARQGEGIGAQLIRQALARALGRAYRAVILVGDAPYYGRFGFNREHTRNLTLPGPVDPARFLGLELTQGSLKLARGMVRGIGDFALPAPAAASIAA